MAGFGGCLRRLLAAQRFIDAFAIGAHRRAWLCGFAHWERLATQRHYVGARNGRIDDLVFLHIVEELWGVVVVLRTTIVVSALIGFRGFLGFRL